MRRHHRRHHRRNPARSSKKSHHVLEWVAAGAVGALLIGVVYASSTGTLNVSPPGLLSGGL